MNIMFHIYTEYNTAIHLLCYYMKSCVEVFQCVLHPFWSTVSVWVIFIRKTVPYIPPENQIIWLGTVATVVEHNINGI